MNRPVAAAPRPHLSVVDGVAMVVGIVLGIGIFKTPPLVAANVASEAAFMGAWLLGGAVTLVGALCYAELAAAHPHTGGEYHFLARAFGTPVAVLFGWARGTVIQTGAIAAIAFVFGDYAGQILPLGEHGAAIYAALAVGLLTIINLIGTPTGRTVQLALSVLTVLAMLAVAAVPLFGVQGGVRVSASAAGEASGGAFGMAMILVLITYGGWNEAAYISAELRDVRRNMVRVLVISTTVITAIYAAVTYAYLASFGLEGLRRSEAIGADLMRLVAGEAGSLVVSAVVVAAALSTLNGTIFTGARTYHAIGQDMPLLARLGGWSARGDNPAAGVLVQGAIALALIGFGATSRNGFQAMVDYTAPVFWSFLLLVGLSLFILRWREPGRHRPFRVPGYPVTPILFCATCTYMIYASIAYTGIGALFGVAVLLAGAPLVLLSRARRRVAAAE
jgi:amino acid transporter